MEVQKNPDLGNGSARGQLQGESSRVEIFSHFFVDLVFIT